MPAPTDPTPTLTTTELEHLDDTQLVPQLVAGVTPSRTYPAIADLAADLWRAVLASGCSADDLAGILRSYELTPTRWLQDAIDGDRRSRGLSVTP